MTSSSQTALRDATLDDALEITAFLARLGLVMPEGDEAVLDHWTRLWRTNPALKAHGSNPALGWVLEDGGRIVGFFGNIPQVSYFDGRPVRVSSARAWAVDEGFRTETPRLCEAFFGQQDTDLVLISSASEPAGRRCLEFGGSAMPQPDYGEILYWVIDASGFLRAGLKKKGRGGVAAWFGGHLGALALNAQMRLGGRRPYAPLDHIAITSVDEIDEGFDDLWARKLKEYPGRLLACRNAETLQWYFSLSQDSGRTRFICYRPQGRWSARTPPGSASNGSRSPTFSSPKTIRQPSRRFWRRLTNTGWRSGATCWKSSACPKACAPTCWPTSPTGAPCRRSRSFSRP